eukprot:363221-Chlamydomonas_euryale.AAC.30
MAGARAARPGRLAAYLGGWLTCVGAGRGVVGGGGLVWGLPRWRSASSRAARNGDWQLQLSMHGPASRSAPRSQTAGWRCKMNATFVCCCFPRSRPGRGVKRDQRKGLGAAPLKQMLAGLLHRRLPLPRRSGTACTCGSSVGHSWTERPGSRGVCAASQGVALVTRGARESGMRFDAL